MSFAGASVLAARRHPGYSHIGSHVSGLAAQGAPSAPVMVSGFVVLGAASSVMETPSPAVRRLLRTAGLATLAAGAFRASSPACPTPFVDADVEPTDIAHAGASMTAFVCWLALPITTARQPGPSWYRRLSSALAIATSVTYALAGVTTRRHSPTRGLAQRAFLATVFLWYAATTGLGGCEGVPLHGARVG
jgi:Protein of unknown function (DUF998)